MPAALNGIERLLLVSFCIKNTKGTKDFKGPFDFFPPCFLKARYSSDKLWAESFASPKWWLEQAFITAAPALGSVC